jgi:uncharacterized protein YdbL (DUF1318 family)
MNRFITWIPLHALLLSACVTINVYFPEAAVEEAADRIIDEVRGSSSAVEDAPADNTGAWRLRELPAHLAIGALQVLIPPAHAQSSTDFKTSSPARRDLEASLRQRFKQLQPYYASGAVGLTSEATIEIRDRSLIPLNDRNRVRQLVSEQTADWEALYAEIARINGHPEWTDDIRRVFAERWVAKAQRGWYYRDAGGTWRQK